ncbi:MAG: hypothetical protein ACKOCT_22345, partial [Alphaproteobacteria bacterium]
TRFTLLVPPGSGPVFAACGDELLDVQETAGFPSDLFAPDRVLLVRPDGHVAWRAPLDRVDPAAVRSALDAVLGRGDRRSAAAAFAPPADLEPKTGPASSS